MKHEVEGEGEEEAESEPRGQSVSKGAEPQTLI